MTMDERIRNLEREVSVWLSAGDYCLDLADITALSQAPVRSMFNTKAEISSTSITVSKIDNLLLFSVFFQYLQGP